MFDLADKYAKRAITKIEITGAFTDTAMECIISGRIYDAIKEYDVLSQSPGASVDAAPSITPRSK